MKSPLLLISLILLIHGGLARAGQYKVSDIPADLLKNVHLVVREDIKHVVVKSETKAVFHRKLVVTVLSKRGEEMNQFSEYYDKISPITSCKAIFYDENGNQVRTYRSSSFTDHSAVSGFSLYDDNRAKSIQIVGNSYPYTVEFNFTQKFRGFIGFPAWVPAIGENISLVSSEYTLTVPENYEFRHKMFNLRDAGPEITDHRKTKTFHWKISHLPALPDEPHKPHFSEYRPFMLLVPLYFSYYGTRGSFETWESFGKWSYSLIEGRDNLPTDAKKKVNELTRGIEDKEEVVRILYNYLQSTTRYVSIQLGIGGLQPFDATTVHKYGYGDCKALSNYMKALLKEAGVNSIYTKIRAGRDKSPIYTDFPAQQSNHVILCVPLGTDTIWLECTSQSNPFGYLGRFNDDREVLLVTPEGGHITRTPSYKLENNLMVRKAEVYITADHPVTKADILITSEGQQYQELYRLGTASEYEQERFLQNSLSIPNFSARNIKLECTKDRNPESRLAAELEMKDYMSFSGNRIFLPLNLLGKSTYIPARSGTRQLDVLISFPYVDIDTIVYYIPEGYIPEFIPQPQELVSDFGEYITKVELEGSAMVYTRKLTINQGRFPSARYDEFVNFHQAIVQTDNTRVLLVKQNR